MTAVTRWRLDIAYDGTDFSGWASQPGRRTVQATLESAIALVLRLPEVQLTVAGRTDAGVHARGQVCHVDLPSIALVEDASEDPTSRSGPPGATRMTRRLARVLPPDVRVRSISVAPAGFDARFAATWRRYAYRVCDAPVVADPLSRRAILTWPRRLDEGAMSEAAAPLLGTHDFAAFCKRREGATTVRTLLDLSWSRDVDVLTALVVADAFCHTMVRSLVGCLVAVGEGRRPVDWPARVLREGKRDSAVQVLPPVGLTLEEVGYPPEGRLAARARDARAVRRLPVPD